MKRKPKKLPKGLEEYEASLDDLNFTRGLLERLMDLPGQELLNELEAFDDVMESVEEVERAAASARETARRVARRMWGYAKKVWTVKQLQEATGYDEE